MSGDAILWDRREEAFAQLVAQRVPPTEARKQAGYSKTGKWSARKLSNEPRIKDRIDFLVASAARLAVLSRSDILEGIREEWRLARLAGQHGPALKAAEMYGSELHGMFRKQLEVGRPGEFEGKSEQELRDYVLSTMKELGLVGSPENLKLIDLQPEESTPETAS